MKLIQLIEITVTDQTSFDLAVELGLICLTPKQCICGRTMHLERGMRRHNIDQRWRCSD